MDYDQTYAEQSPSEQNPGEQETGTAGERRRNVGGALRGNRNLWMMAGGALGALAILGFGKRFGKIRPVAVSAVRETYGFKEWVAGKLERAREDVEDVVAEAVFGYHKDLSATMDAVRREKELLEKIEKAVEKKLSRMQP